MNNPVADAIDKAGGIVEVCALLRVTNPAVYQWKKWGRMPTDTPEARERAIALSRASGVPLLELLGFKVVRGRGGQSRVRLIGDAPGLVRRCYESSNGSPAESARVAA